MSGDDELQALFDAAHVRWRLLNLAAHPTGFGLTQTHDETLDLMTFRPEYDPGACHASLALGVFVLRLLLRHVAGLDGHPDQWLTSRARFDDVARAFGESLHAALAAEARALDEERARNPKQMTPCTRNRWERRRQAAGNEARGEDPRRGAIRAL